MNATLIVASNDPLEPEPRLTVTRYVALEPMITGLGDCASTITAPTFPVLLIARLTVFDVTVPHALVALPVTTTS